MKKIIALIMAVICVVGVSTPVAAYSPIDMFGNKVDTNILKTCGNETDGEKQISCVLKLVVTIFSIGVGILGVIGISVSGIQYLTAGGSEEKTRKAKRRIYEIVIGLALYAVFFAALTWLLPGF
jgi:cytochrome bd-type quinol oxidase subunit 2